MITNAQALARVHRIMVDEPWGGYTQGGNRIEKTPAKSYDVYGRKVSIPAHDMDCSSSIALAIWVVFGTLPFTYTGNEYAGLTSNGWKAHKVDRHKCWDGYAPKAGDVVLRDGHTAMFQDAGQTISEFSANEKRAATGGRAGDQTGWESRLTSYASTGKWNWVFECPAGEWASGKTSSKKATGQKATAAKAKETATKATPRVAETEDTMVIVEPRENGRALGFQALVTGSGITKLTESAQSQALAAIGVGTKVITKAQWEALGKVLPTGTARS